VVDSVSGAPSASSALAADGYLPVPGWPGVSQLAMFGGDATSVAVDSRDRVYVFSRGPIPMVVFDRDGRQLSQWGQGDFDEPHSVATADDDTLFVVDAGGHVVQKRTVDGDVIFTIGRRGKAARPQSGDYFNRPTDIAIQRSTGNLFVSDGYANSRVHVFSPDGVHLLSWGEPGDDHGQFSLPHGLVVTDDDRVIVCDRENFRLQVFTTDGRFLDAWPLHRPAAICVSPVTGHLYVAQMPPPAFQYGVANLGCRVSMLDQGGTRLARFGAALPGFGLDQFVAPHSVAVDSQDNVYVAEVAATYSARSLKRDLPPGEVISLRKWSRAAEPRDQPTSATG
jgi:DNA-binding beta-propeller fold protein YncE